nr:flocculation protein FLO11-like [Tanacetum cinerariifolium]
MGKTQPQLPVQQDQNLNGSSSFVGFRNGFKRLFSFKCLFMVFLAFGLSLFALFSLVKFQHQGIGFDAKESIKQSATVQAYFRLEKPVTYLVHQISRLEYDINDEIGVPGTQFPGGITIIPKLSPQAQLKSGLQLMPYESIFVKVTNKAGSTIDPPVTVQASVLTASPDNEPKESLPPVSSAPYCGGSTISPAPSPVSVPRHHALPPHASTSPPPRSEVPPNLSPLPAVSYGSRPRQDNGYQKGPSQPFADDSLVEEVEPVQPKRKYTRRSKPTKKNDKEFVEPRTIEEEIALCTTFVAKSEDSIEGNGKKAVGFWREVAEHFHEEMGEDKRSYDSVNC